MDTPTLAGFIVFIRTVMQINTTVLPDDSTFIVWAFNVAMEIVNDQIALASSLMYTLAVYNLGGDNLLNYAPDLPDAPLYPPDNADGTTFFMYMRTKFNLTGFVSGVITAANDETTGQSLQVPDAFKGLTISDLQNLKTPYGRQYLAIAQRYGEIWGLT